LAGGDVGWGARRDFRPQEKELRNVVGRVRKLSLEDHSPVDKVKNKDGISIE
jgi:hypothetical protein